MAFKDAAGTLAGLRLPRTAMSQGREQNQRGRGMSSYNYFKGSIS
jgi:hypothetical protein